LQPEPPTGIFRAIATHYCQALHVTRKDSLRSLLQAVFRYPTERTAVNSLIRICHTMAVTYLRMKDRGPGGSAARSGLTHSDLAYDAIADLFRRDVEGMLPEFLAYFHRVAPPETSDEDTLFVALRRLVFSATNQREFRINGEIDPPLARVIRNIKLTVKRHPLMYSSELFGEPVLIASDRGHCCRRDPLMPPELIAPLFHARTSPRASLMEMLVSLAEVLRSQQGYEPAVRLLDAARMVRAVQSSVPDDEPVLSPHDGLAAHDLRIVIGEAMSRLERSAARSYVVTGKLPDPMLRIYLKTVRAILEEEFLSADGHNSTYHGHLAAHLPDLTVETYRSRHRTVVEYLAKMGKTETRHLLRNDW